MGVIYTFWTGRNPLSSARRACLEQLEAVSECAVVLVTPDTIGRYILPEAPLHEAYNYLSETHKADYLRTYFMNFHGGGYSDIKRTTGSWKQAFTDMESAPDKWINGYREVEGGVGHPPAVAHWRELVGNCAYVCRPRTPLTHAWYSEMIVLLEARLPRLRDNPARHPQDFYRREGSAYPLEWNEMLGRIFHRVCFGFRDRLLQTVPPCVFADYR